MAGSSTKKKTTGTAGKSAGRPAAKSGGRTSGTGGRRSGTKETLQQAEEPGFLQSEVVILGTFAVCAFLFLCNFHICGAVGDWFSTVLLGVFGSIGYAAPIFLFLGMIFYASNIGNIRAVYKILAVEVLLIVLCGLAQLLFGGGYKEGQTLLEIYQLAGEKGLGGGIIGGALVLILHKAVGTIGSYLVLLLFLIISIVCITEKSFVSVVKSGSGKAYQYAREDYGRRREVREERREERRLLKEEEKRVKGVNLASTNLSQNDGGGFVRVPSQASPVVSEAAEKAALRELERPDIQEAEREALWQMSGAHEAAVPETAKDTKEASGWEARRTNRADVFRGKIVMPGKKEEDVVPFDEDFPSITAGPRDADVFVSRDVDEFNSMNLFLDDQKPVRNPEGEKPLEEERLIKEEKKPESAPEEEEGYLDDDYIDDFEQFERLLTEPYVESEENWESVAVQSRRKEAVPVSREESVPAGSNEPVQEDYDAYDEGVIPVPSGSDDGMFCTEERTKTVVTSSGKVIETDTEALAKKTVETRRMDAAKKAETDGSMRHEMKKTEEKPKKPYVIPPLTLLTKGTGQENGMSEKEYKETAIKLQQTLQNFGVGVTVTNISCGPTVTRYELHPEQGVKVSRILSLADDIKLNLAAADIRIEAPIPGKAAVGIEVPNRVNSTVYLRDLLESEEFKNHPSRLAFAVGKDIGGQTIVADLAKMPHLLIAGQTGSGKSVGINTMIMSIIYHARPEDVKLIMVDPKVVELSVYNGIPHLLIPVVTDPKKAAGALNWAVAEMTDRYNKFAASNVRDLKGYNAKVAALLESGDVPLEEAPAKLPQIVIIIDELADLMMVASGEVEDSICRLAQLARAAGIHLVIATQRPSVNVITGVIKANVPSRIAFSVASGTDSRTILDMNGAEKLLGNGDMLFYPSGFPKPIRVQGSFVSDSEVSQVTDFLKEQNEDAGYDTAVEAKMNQPSLGGSGQSERDTLFTDAGKFIIEKDKASIGMLQRVFKIGFNRAARIMDQLAEAGVVGEEEGTKPRKILMSMEEFEGFIEAGY